MSPSLKKAKKKKKLKAALTPQQIKAKEERAHRTKVESLLRKVGFKKVQTDGIEITFEGRTGEFDAIFVFENVILVAEYTTAKSGSTHLLTKKVIFDLALDNSQKFVKFCRQQYTGFASAVDSVYSDKQCQVRILYASKSEPSEEVQNLCLRYQFIYGTRAKYFESLSKAIERSARIEFLKFLRVDHDKFGKNAIGNSAMQVKYDGLLLPEENSSYPSGYRVTIVLCGRRGTD